VRNPAADARFSITCSRRNGIERLCLVGALDRSNVLMLESELNAFAREGGALVLDLAALTSIGRWGLRTLERVARRSDRRTSPLFIVNVRGPILDAFRTAGMGDLLSGTDLSDLLDAGDGEWSPISSLPPFLGRRASGERQLVGEQP
jgi:anti-anti-sigma factor